MKDFFNKTKQSCIGKRQTGGARFFPAMMLLSEQINELQLISQ